MKHRILPMKHRILNGLTTERYRQRSSNAAAASAAADGVITSSSGGTPDSIFLDMLPSTGPGREP